MKAVILPTDVEYQPFTDAQIDSFAKATGSEYANPDQAWRDDLDEAAKELRIEYAAKGWPTPSAMRKKLAVVSRNPDKFIDRLANDAELRESPIVTAILHGTGWHPDRLARAGEYRDQFIAGVKREIERLDRIIEWRKEQKVTGHGRDTAMDAFIDRLVSIYQDAFWKAANDGLSVCDEPDGPFIRFARAVLNALRGGTISGFAIRKRLDHSGGYQVAKQTGFDSDMAA